ncbi:MAG: alpha/beta fold hydrolase [Desulfurococcales archaeon]|nr:alpha/beta fold hydrolase [Desulfurococcales archaeon]
MHKYAKLLDEMIGLLNIDLYGLRGVLAGGRLLVFALREGATNVYSYDGKELVRLNREPVSLVAEAPYDADRVVIARDVARGKEQHALFTIDPDRPGEEERVPGVEPARIMGVAYDGERIVYSASSAAEVALFLSEGSGTRKVATLQGMAMVTDLHYPYATGIGSLGPEALMSGRFQLFTVDLESGNVSVYSDPEGSVAAARFTPEGSIVFSVERPEDAVLKVIEPGGDRPAPLQLPYTDLEGFQPRSFNYIGVTRDGSLVTVARKNGRSRIFLDGKEIPAPTGLHGAVYQWRGRLVASHTSLSTPPRIISLDTGEPILQGDVPGYVAEAIGGSSFTWVESFDGERVPVLVLESRRAGRPGPTVVLVHGGPFSEDADVWDIFAASLALAGFNVVMPNYRGSTGYGERWRLKIVGDPCGGELEDITAAAKWALNSGIASHLYVMGYSYGGYMTLCSLTRKPGLYRAGVAGASVADWEEMYELSDAVFRMFIDMIFAGRRELWRERSPITYVENLREPLALIQPQNDTRTPLKPVLHFIEKATELGKRVEAHVAPDMGHAVNTVDDVLKILWPAVLFLARAEEGRV